MSGEQSTAPAQRPLRVPSREELPPLMPRPPLAIVDEGITFLRLDPLLLFGIALVVLLPMRLIAAAIPGNPLRDARPDELLDIFVANTDAPGAATAAVATILLESIALFAVAAIYGHLLSLWYGGRALPAADLLVESIKRAPLVVVAWFLVHLAEAAGALFTCGIVGLFFGVMFTVSAPTMGAEHAGPLTALKRSWLLVGSRFVHVLLVFTASGIGALVLKLAIEFVPSLIGLELLDLPLWLVSGVADFVGSVIATAFVAAVSAVLYLDLRVRAEGIDLELAMVDAFGPDAVVRRG